MEPESEIDKTRPEEAETLARIKQQKIKKLEIYQQRLAKLAWPRWTAKAELIWLVILFLANAWLLYPFLGQEDTSNIFSAPLLPTLAGLTSVITPVTYGIRFWLVIFLFALPFPLYFFVKDITHKKLVAALASLIVCLPFGFFMPMRVQAALFEGDGARVASLTLVMLVCWLLIHFLQEGKFTYGLGASLATAAIALTSPLGLVVMFCFAMVITFSEMILGFGRLKLFRFLTVFLLALGFVAFWYNPKFIYLVLVSPQGQQFRTTLANIFPLSFFIVPLSATLGFLIFEDRPQLQPLFVAVFLTAIFSLLSLGSHDGLSLPSRYLTALGIAMAFLASLLINGAWNIMGGVALIKKTRVIERYKEFFPYVTLGFMGALLFFVFTSNIGYLSDMTLFDSNGDVLGAADVKTTGVWNMQERVAVTDKLFGGVISLSTVGAVVFVKSKLKQENQLRKV